MKIERKEEGDINKEKEREMRDNERETKVDIKGFIKRYINKK